MSRYTALLDANILYPAPMRDLFMQLALTDLFNAKSSTGSGSRRCSAMNPTETGQLWSARGTT